MTECSICLGTCPESNYHSLPECGHTFHVNCIVSWFRSGRNSCPLCKEEGVNTQWSELRYPSKMRFLLLKRISNWKNAPPFLKHEIMDFDKRQKSIRSEKRELNKYKNEACGNYTEISKNVKKMENVILKKEKKQRRHMRQICSAQVDHIIIPIRKTLFE